MLSRYLIGVAFCLIGLFSLSGCSIQERLPEGVHTEVHVYELYDEKDILSVRQSVEMKKALKSFDGKIQFQRVHFFDRETLPVERFRCAFPAPNVFIVKFWKKTSTGTFLCSLDVSLGGCEGYCVKAENIVCNIQSILDETVSRQWLENKVFNLRE